MLSLAAFSLATAVDVRVEVDATATSPFDNVFWKRSFGSGHAKLTNRADWQSHLAQAVTDLGLLGVRYHGLFNDDMGVVQAHRTYNWTKADAAWDYQVKQGVTPIVELSFMPAVLANCTWVPPSGGAAVNPGHDACRHTTMKYRGIIQAPAVWDDWRHLVGALASHLVERYTLAAVRTWRFEVWNELWGMPFPSDYMQLFRASSAALKAVDPGLRVGGPATAQLQDAAAFVTACETASPPIPYDFVSTHMYPTDPQCPRGEQWGPDCLPAKVKALRATIDAKIPLLLTEYNVGCCLGYAQHDTSAAGECSFMYRYISRESCSQFDSLPLTSLTIFSNRYAAAAFAFRTVPQLAGVVDVLSWWTFSDVFEEGGLPTTEFQDIYGLMTYHGIPKPGWRGFELLHTFAGDTQLRATVTEAAAAQSAEGAALAPLPCYVENATDLSDFDILPDSQHLSAPSAAACCARCRAYNATSTKCTFWTWESAEARCYLKTSDAGRRRDAKFTSGSIVPPPPPPPPSQLISAFATEGKARAFAGGHDGESGASSIAVFLGFWENGGAVSNLDNRSVTVVIQAAARSIADLNAAPTVVAHIIDATRANPLAAWEAMGSPAVSVLLFTVTFYSES